MNYFQERVNSCRFQIPESEMKVLNISHDCRSLNEVLRCITVKEIKYKNIYDLDLKISRNEKTNYGNLNIDMVRHNPPKIEELIKIRDYFQENKNSVNIITGIFNKESYQTLSVLKSITEFEIKSEQSKQLQKRLYEQAPRAPDKEESFTWAKGMIPAPKPRNYFEYINWQTINETHIIHNLDMDIPQELSCMQEINDFLPHNRKLIIENFENSYKNVQIVFIYFK